MQLSSRSDEELVTLARRGWPAPFAVLLHRHGATVRAAVAGRSDPDAAVVSTFTRAMQQLRRMDPAAPVEPWLLALAPGRRGRTAPPDDLPRALDAPQVDALWAELAPRWPQGRTPRRRLPTWLRWSLLTIVLMALAVVIPYATITTGQRAITTDTDAELLRAALMEPEDATDDDVADGGGLDDGPSTDADGSDDDDGSDDADGSDPVGDVPADGTEDRTVTPGDVPTPDAPAPEGPAPGEDGP